ncbi:OTU domain-containing protein 3 isoform X1 [Triplophysa dalaica]|uniref:OTU domain-containing protein 3 isoform X1 n=1 Tax=Triplophysa dalaica TaxID=1582913 RepID=UPI0024DFBE38|nr:OTU domain-containing protein 3 isoform X1 [Triplophysa dalaica]
MSRKQSTKPIQRNKKCEIERKRDDRAARRALAKDRKNRPPGEDVEEFVSFSNQLQALGLKLREVPGDGNCLFRALGDQLEGHSRGHLRLRQETVQYMSTHRLDFEPFVEDDVPFAKHVLNLSQPGTFAGNDAIVAFARRQQVKVVIHQLNAPLWEINGTEKSTYRELHIAYRYGDHYDSVRKIGDNSEDPAHLCIEKLNNSRRFGDGQKDNHRDPSPSQSLTEDEELILSLVCADSQSENLCQPSATSQKCHSDWMDSELNNQLAERDSASETHPLFQSMQAECSEIKSTTEGSISHKLKLSSKQRKEQQRREKKKRQEERHRQKVLQERGSHDQNQNPPEAVTLVPALNTLSI